jgi:hypothetical protein
MRWDGDSGTDIVANRGRKEHGATIAGIDHGRDCECVYCDCTSFNGGTFFGGDGVVTGLRNRRCCTRGLLTEYILLS